ncbi:MAG: lysophospholipid acyltransferase family protein [Bacteroidota bacterium]|jgi:KDO2-lipid IV(A) lauroyltransferase
MANVIFYCTLPLLYFISILPFPLFYGLSDGVCFLLYNVFGYRKKVVFENLRKSFPNKTLQELKQLEKKFYHYLCDLFLETLKTLTISKKEAIRRCKFSEGTIQLLNDLSEKKQSCIIVMGHYGNWEWAGNSFSLQCKQQLYVIYHPLTSKPFNKLMYGMRTRFGTKLYAMKDTMREMIKNRHELNATAFIADQTPSPEGAYWTKFLNQDTPVFWGTEKIAQKLNYPVVFVTINRIKRGFYEVNSELLVSESKNTKEGEISELHTRKLEKDILKQPEIWLWSHRRWKHKKIES